MSPITSLPELIGPAPYHHDTNIFGSGVPVNKRIRRLFQLGRVGLDTLLASGPTGLRTVVLPVFSSGIFGIFLDVFA